MPLSSYKRAQHAELDLATHKISPGSVSLRENRQTETERDRETVTEIETETERQTAKQTETGRQTDQTDRQRRDRQTEI